MKARCRIASRAARAATVSAVLGVAAALACAQAAGPRDGAAVTTAGPGAADGRFEEAMLAYERNHWSLAFQRLSTLADDGHPEAARIALQMRRHGPKLYRSEFGASAEQLERWVLVMVCAGDGSGASCERGLQARQTH